MIISTPDIKTTNDRVIVSAQITFEHRPLNKPNTAWFSFPVKFVPFISGRADPFAASLLPLALILQEDLLINGPISPRLINGMREYQQAMSFWYPYMMHPVKIKASTQEALPLDQAGKNCVTLFSGGVDSSYTLMSHLPQHEQNPAYQVKGALFIHGMDIPLQNKTSYEKSLQIFKMQLSPLGVDVISCATNLHYFSSGLLSWEIAHGSALIGSGLVLDKLISSLLIPSSDTIDDLVPWGSSPMIDHLLSTETVKVIHQGSTVLRIDKVTAISSWQPARSFLRVCTDENNRSAVNNCSKCEKCLRTMTMLQACDALAEFKTFQQPFRKWAILKWTPQYDIWSEQTLKLAQARHKKELFLPLKIVTYKAKVLNELRRLIPQWLFNRLKKKVFPYQNDLFNPDLLYKEFKSNVLT